MNFQQLENFLMICQEGSITAASKKLFITQPALSQQISRIEAELGTAVFHRNNSVLELTAAGERLRTSAENILHEYQKLQDDLTLPSGPSRQYLSVATTKTRSFLPMTYLLPLFHASNPDIHVNIVEVNSYQVEETILSGKADMGFCQPPNYLPIKTELVYEDEILVAVPPDHPLNQEKHPFNGRHPVLFARDLDRQPFIQGAPGNYTQNMAQMYFSEHHIRPHYVTRSGAPEFIHFFTAVGTGCSFTSEISTLLLPSFQRSPVYYSIGDESLKLPFYIGYREGTLVTSTMRCFIDFAKKEFPNIYRIRETTP
ncbi:MAG: LysR family transcriptional regulator [Eubacteriales bacterium]|nr:LysR family transcriptional regulator [Eubacteriales bacterium]